MSKENYLLTNNQPAVTVATNKRKQAMAIAFWPIGSERHCRSYCAASGGVSDAVTNIKMVQKTTINPQWTVPASKPAQARWQLHGTTARLKWWQRCKCPGVEASDNVKRPK